MRLDLAPEQFGFQHEGPFGNHQFSFSEPVEDLDRVAVGLADFDIADLKDLRIALDKDELAGAVSLNRSLRQSQDARFRVRIDTHRGKHLGLQSSVRIGQLEPEPHGSCGWFQYVADVRDFSAEDLGRIGLDAHFYELIGHQVIGMDVRNIFFRNIGRHPDLGQIRNLEETGGRFNHLPFCEVPRDHSTIERRDDRHVRSDLLIPVQTRNQIIPHP